MNAGNLYGGIETILVTLARERRACPGMEPEFALCWEGRLADELRREGVPVHLLGAVRARYPWTVIRARSALRDVLETTRPDVVVTHASWPHALAAPVVRDHGARLAHWAHARAGGAWWIGAWARRTPPDVVIANSRFTAEETVFTGVPTRVVYAPVSEAKPGRGRADVRRELEAPEGAVVILAASRIEKLKGLAVFIEALAGLEGSWVAWIAGGAQRPEERAHLEQLEGLVRARKLGGRVRFLGQRADTRDLMGASDVFCQANTAPDSFGLVFIEALAAGLPVVTSALGGAREIVDETCGRLVEPGSAEALRGALTRLTTDADLRRRLGAAGPARVRSLCSPEARLAELQRSLVGVQA